MPVVHPIDKASRLPVLSRLLYRLCFPRLAGSTYGGKVACHRDTPSGEWYEVGQGSMSLG